MPKPFACRASTRFQMLPVVVLTLLSLLTVVWWAPGMPETGQDSAWVLAVNQAVANHLSFGRQVIFNIGPWGCVYAGQYHPATDGMMLGGGTLIACALAAGLSVLARGWRRWLVLLAPVLIATVGLHDPVFVAMPLLLLAVSVALTQPAPAPGAIRRDTWGIAALMLLAVGAALLTFVKGTFETHAVPMAILSVLAIASGRRFRLALLALVVYGAAAAAFWMLAGQRLDGLPRYLATLPMLISGYTEGGAASGPWTDIAAYLAAAALLGWCVGRDRGPGRRLVDAALPLGVAYTVFVAFKAGFVRHDEHALIAVGSLAMMPFTLVRVLRASSLALCVVATLAALAFVSGHYADYPWPSFSNGYERVAGAAEGAWSRLTEPGALPRQFGARMAAIRAAAPLPPVSGPADIYSSGQTILLANGIEWSPRPALQSVTVYSAAMAHADLDHLRGEDGGPALDTVFYRVEDEDDRLPSTQDGLSWPALLSQFRADTYDRAIDTVLLRRRPGQPVAEPSATALMAGRYAIDTEVALPAAGPDLLWANLRIRPTVAGRVVAFLFRPPALFITVRYANGPPERRRLLSSLAEAGFLLTPHVRDTQDLLRVLLPEFRTTSYRPVSITISGERGTGWLWRHTFDLTLRTMPIPTQDALEPALLTTPVALLVDAGRDVAAPRADACAIDLIDGRPVPPGTAKVSGITRITGWSVVSITQGLPPGRVFVRLTDPAGQVVEAPTQPGLTRPDVGGYFVNPALSASGFDADLDLTSMAGPFTLTLEAEREGRRWRCGLTQAVVVVPLRTE